MSGRYPKWLILLVEIVFFIGLYLGFRAWQQKDIVSGQAPMFSTTTLDGEYITSRDYRGEPLLIHFWATWCPVCRFEQDTIQAIAQDWPVVTVATQSGGIDEISAYLDEHDLDFPVIIDSDGDMASRYGIAGVPTSFILDSEGEIRFTTVGYTTEIGLRSRLWWTTLSFDFLISSINYGASDIGMAQPAQPGRWSL